MAHYGQVNGNATEATIALTVHSNDGNNEEIIFVIDTGDTGDLSLPQEIIDRLNLEQIVEEEPVLATMADGVTQLVSIYAAQTLWHGQMHEVEVVNLGPDPLIGMGLLRGCNINVDAVPGGLVTITELSVPS